MLNAPLSIHADAETIAAKWKDTSAEVCPVCGMRPQGPSKKAKGRKVCDVCERRRQDRAKDWANDLSTTIWTDEVADVNGRLALVVGQFNLDEWLNGKMVQTLTVTEPQAGKAETKNPSFARLRRVWETTRAFWESALDELQPDGKPTIPSLNRRLEIVPRNRQQLDLGKFHTYELVVNGARVSVVWDNQREQAIHHLRQPRLPCQTRTDRQVGRTNHPRKQNNHYRRTERLWRERSNLG